MNKTQIFVIVISGIFLGAIISFGFGFLILSDNNQNNIPIKTSTPTPTPVETPQETPTESQWENTPPGITNENVDINTLINAHATVTDAMKEKATIKKEQSEIYLTEMNTSVKYIQSLVDGASVYVTQNGTFYPNNTIRELNPNRGPNIQYLQEFSKYTSFTIDSVTKTNNTRFFSLSATGLNTTESINPKPTNFSMSLVVREDGFIESFEIEYSLNQIEEQQTLNITVQYEELSEITPPAWYLNQRPPT